MKVYIIYDRYERDEWYQVYYIGLNRQESVKKFKEEELPSFLEYGPDDCHSFQLQEVKMTKEQYEHFMSLNPIEHEIYYDENDELFNIMYDIYDSGEKVIFSTDGVTDNYEIFKLFMHLVYPKVEEGSDRYYDLQMEFYNSDEDYHAWMKVYINATY